MSFTRLLVLFLINVWMGCLSAAAQTSDEQRGDQSLKSGDYPAAIAAYSRALALDPDNVQLVCSRGCAYDFSGDHRNAIHDLNHAINLKPDFAGAYVNRARAYNALHITEQALADANKAISLDPKMEAAYITRGSIYRYLGKLDLSCADEDTAISINSSDSIAYVDRAVDYIQTNEFAKAIADLNKALALGAPQNAGSDYDEVHIYDMRGECYLNTNQMDLALADANCAVGADSSNPAHLLLRANIYCKDLNYESALGDLGNVIKLDPQNSAAYLLAGKIRESQFQFAKALQNYERALVCAPNDIECNTTLAWFLATCPNDKLRDGKRAEKLAADACRANQEANPVLLDTLAAAYAEAGDFSDAVSSELNAIKGLDGVNPKYQDRLALYQDHIAYHEPSPGQ